MVKSLNLFRKLEEFKMSFFKVLIFRNLRNGERKFESEGKFNDYESALKYLVDCGLKNNNVSKVDFVYEFWENGQKRSNPQLIQELLTFIAIQPQILKLERINRKKNTVKSVKSGKGARKASVSSSD